MALESLCWLGIAACGLHVVEEELLGWREWVRSVSGIVVSRGFFLGANGIALAIGAGFAAVANRLPMLGLAIAALMLMNATFFHVGVFLWTRRRFSPGLITAVTLFYPLGIWCFKSAHDAGVLTAATLIGSFVLGAVFMAAPMLLFRAGSLRRV